MQDTYSILRYFADTWGLVGLNLFFAAGALWAFRPSARRLYRNAASIPLERSDDLEADVKAAEKHDRKPQQEART